MHALKTAAIMIGLVLTMNACSSGMDDDAKTLEPSSSFDAVFKLYDTNNDGLVSDVELASVETAENSTRINSDESARLVVEGFDMSGDGFLDKVEFTGTLNKKILLGVNRVPGWAERK